MERLRSPNFDDRPDATPVDMLVLHYTGMESAAAALDRLCDPASRVSAHYVIDEAGGVFALVPEERRAWHAGVSFWRGRTDINGRSIGVELVNPGHEFGYRPYPEAQMAALEGLAREIVSRHAIPPRNVVGHSDVAPSRKRDPGELFDWARLAESGIGLWPGRRQAGEEIGEEDPGAVRDLLGRLGYATEDLGAAVAAFQRHFRPARIDGVADAETLGRLAGVLNLCR